MRTPSTTLPLRPESIELVKRSWKSVLPISDAAASMFYERLFSQSPALRPLFKGDFEEQKKKLMQTLNVAVDGLNKPQSLLPVLEKLGERHASYMVQEPHYKLVGDALLWTLQEGLGEEFTPEIASAWAEVYDFLSGVMKRAARTRSAPGLPVFRPPAQVSRPKPSDLIPADDQLTEHQANSAPKAPPMLSAPLPPQDAPSTVSIQLPQRVVLALEKSELKLELNVSGAALEQLAPKIIPEALEARLRSLEAREALPDNVPKLPAVLRPIGIIGVLGSVAGLVALFASQGVALSVGALLLVVLLGSAFLLGLGWAPR